MRKRLSKNKVLSYMVMGFLCFDLYWLSFLLLAQPREDNLAPYDPCITSGYLPPAPGDTLVRVSQAPAVNKAAYWFYLPVHKFLEWRGVLYFPYEANDGQAAIEKNEEGASERSR